MINDIEIYRESGQKTAQARNQRDEARACFHQNWFSRAKAMEQESDRRGVQQAFDEGYREARAVAPGCSV